MKTEKGRNSNSGSGFKEVKERNVFVVAILLWLNIFWWLFPLFIIFYTQYFFAINMHETFQMSFFQNRNLYYEATCFSIFKAKMFKFCLLTLVVGNRAQCFKNFIFMVQHKLRWFRL